MPILGERKFNRKRCFQCKFDEKDVYSNSSTGNLIADSRQIFCQFQANLMPILGVSSNNSAGNLIAESRQVYCHF